MPQGPAAPHFNRPSWSELGGPATPAALHHISESGLLPAWSLAEALEEEGRYPQSDMQVSCFVAAKDL